MCFKSPCPALASNIPASEWGRRVLSSSDQFIVDDAFYFVLGNLDVPIHGIDEPLRWTVWGSLSERHFNRASDLWHTDGREQEPAYFSWLNNRIPGYPDTVNIRCLMHTQPLGIRPTIQVIEADHPLARDQQQGISPARAHALIHAALDSA